MKAIRTIGVVGAGTMGAALAQKFAQENFKVILADKEVQYVNLGLAAIKAMLGEAVDRKVFTPEQIEVFQANLTGTANLNELESCDLVIEAVYEDLNIKKELFKALSSIVREDTILATNTSSFSVNELAGSVSNPQRFLGLHFFYHAAKNRLVEIIPGESTSAEVLECIKLFSAETGKDAIVSADSYGFIVNRFFVPWLNEAVRLLQESAGNIPTIDDVCVKVFGIGMGPFALMNATGVPIAYHAQKTLEVFGPFYEVAERLAQQAELNHLWNLEGEVSTNEEERKEIKDRMLAVVFLICSQLLDEKVCSAAEINRGARIGLKWRKGPIDLMKQSGALEVTKLVEDLIQPYKLKLPQSIGNGFWKMNYVRLQFVGKQAVITIDRPEDLNSLNEEVMAQLEEKFTIAEAGEETETIFITGSGKAFVAGADIKFFVDHIRTKQISNIIDFSAYGQKVFEQIDVCEKKVVAIINGLALGGGLELALCADVILALPKAQIAFPETGIGIYPGLGGTQRTAKKVGKSLAKYLILTGKMVGAADALEMGLVDGIVDYPEMYELFRGEKPVRTRPRDTTTARWMNISRFFESNDLADLLSLQYIVHDMPADEAEKIAFTIKQKAPIAITIADKLIQEAPGCEAELSYLNEIFSSADALVGLTSIGKKVTYEGR